MLPPKIDTREKKDLIEQLKEMVPYYTPEWRFNPDDPDPGTTLSLIFAELFYGNIQRFNRVPLKHFIGFLNLLDITLNTPKPSSTYVTFHLTTGAKEPVFVKKGTKVLGQEETGESISFEVENHFFVSPAKLLDCYKVCSNPDRIIKVPEHIFIHNNEENKNEQKQECEMYTFTAEENMQKHSLYIGHDFMFNLSSTVKIEIELIHPYKHYKEKEMAQWLADTKYVEWYYFSNGNWQMFDFVEADRNKIILHKTKEQPLEKKEILDSISRWIQCRIPDISLGNITEDYTNIELGQIRVKTDYFDVNQKGGFLPDMLFQDDLHIYLGEEKGFYPFGQFFLPYSSFYISSQEAFSKKGSKISLHFDLKMVPNELKTNMDSPIEWKLIMKESDFKKADPQPIHVMKVSWEYWNGFSWVILPMDDEYSEFFYSNNETEKRFQIDFTCPTDIEETYVNSQYNYWIRARIVSIDHIRAPELIYFSPWIKNMQITYQSLDNFQEVDQCVTENNLEWKNEIDQLRSEGFVFRPFINVFSRYPAFYLGFDQPLENGPMSLYFDFQDFPITEQTKPIIEWEYLRKNGSNFEWSPLKFIDGTDSLTKSGEVRIFGKNDFAYESLFSKKRYWIRLVNRKITVNTPIEGSSPKLRGLYFNTTKVVQQEHIQSENPNFVKDINSSFFQLAYFPVLSEEVWVDEAENISEEEVSILQKNEKVRVIRDSGQNILRCWVLWENVPHFINSKAADRHYVIDRSVGKIMFGDGQKGKQPPRMNSDYIQVNYKIGGGIKGNIDKYQINKLESSIPFIDAVYNPIPAGGGSELEKLEDALVRGPKLIKHRNRAVTIEDFEWIVREAAQNVAKVKCLSNYNAQIEREVGAITIVVLPEGGVSGMQVFPQIKARIEKYLLERAANTIAFPEKIQIIKPAFLEISLTVTLVVKDVEMIVETELEAIRKLNKFLDPLKGNEGNGWEIGQQIHISVFYSFLKSIRHVNYVEKLYMTVKKIEHGKEEELEVYDSLYVPHGIVKNGKHTIYVKTL